MITETPGPTSSSSRLGKRVSVLVVEDLADAADSLARFLRVACGYEVMVALDGERGLRAALATHPDVVVCDIGLPKLSGLDVARRLAATDDYHPLLIAVTAYGGVYPEEKAREAGFDHYLVKPADPFQIEALVEDFWQPRPADEA
jgi:two-component system, chemotaxis family, CheB/CheR fusion protein